MTARWLIPVLGLTLTVSTALADDAGSVPAPAAPAAAPAVPAAAPVATPAAPATPAAAPVATPAAPATPAAAAKAAKGQPPTFSRDPALEEMRYQHLWIAYGAIWLIIFFFVFRTWRQGERTAGELEDLKSRLADLEGRNDSE